MLNKLLKNKLFPDKLQWITVLFLIPVLGYLLFGPADKYNIANLLVWVTWWPLLCLLFLIAGRVWCALCPFSLLSRLTQRFAGLHLAVPDFLKQHGGWIIMIAVLLLFWFEETNNVMDSPRRTAVILLSILTGAVVFGLFLRGRAWCRYICPLGGISLVYARTALYKVRSNEAACADCTTKDCVVPDADYAGCPMHLSPFAIDTVSNCCFCGSCVKRCTNDSMKVSFEAPSIDLSGQSSVTKIVVWLIAMLAGLFTFFNLLDSTHLPLLSWLHHSPYPVFLKTLMMAGAMLITSALFAGFVRLAADPNTKLPLARLRQLCALPLIPLLLFSHLGHVSRQIWDNGRHLLAIPANLLGVTWLQPDFLLAVSWTKYFSPFCTLLGLSLTLFVSHWVLSRESEVPTHRIRISFGLFYVIYAGWNLFAVWPLSAPPQASLVLPTVLSGSQDGWTFLWPFIGINTALLTLALIVKRSEKQAGSDAEQVDFSASRSWVIRDTSGTRQTEMLEWLLEQAVEAKWRVPAVVRLSNATTEIVTFLQRTLTEGSPVTVNAILRKNKGVMTIVHEGGPLTLPDYKALTSLDKLDEATLDGLELRLAVAQVEQMSYQARLSERRCSFTLRQTC